MVGGQVLIIFVGGRAFKIVPLDSKEWGLSIGLGAISILWGVAIRKFPDLWANTIGSAVGSAIIKIFSMLFSCMKKKHVETVEEGKALDDSSSDNFQPPLRVMTTIRGL